MPFWGQAESCVLFYHVGPAPNLLITISGRPRLRHTTRSELYVRQHAGLGSMVALCCASLVGGAHLVPLSAHQCLRTAVPRLPKGLHPGREEKWEHAVLDDELDGVQGVQRTLLWSVPARE